MAYCDDGYGNTYWPAPLFSTPLVTYEGTPAGDPLYGDNARLLRDTMDVVAAYRSAVGSLEVTIEPTEVRAAGAQWRRVGTDIWLNSGVLENNLPTGDHIVEFKAVIGWDQPANVNVKILSGQTTTAMGTYTLPESDIEFNENFESYDLNAWPDSWIKDANAIDLLNNYIAADLTNSENKVLRIYGEIGGCWPAIAYQQFTYANNFYIEYTVYNGSENLTGCNPVRGEVGLRQGASLDSGHSRILLSFLENGDAQAADGSMLGNYALNQWHDILIHYQRKESALNLAYTIEGEFLQEIAVVVENTANEQLLDHLAVSAQEGPVYFDDISFYQHKKRAMPWIQLLLLN